MECAVSEEDLETLTMRRSRPTGGEIWLNIGTTLEQRWLPSILAGVVVEGTVHVLAKKAYRESKVISPLILKVDSRCMGVVSFTLRSLNLSR